MRVVAPDTTREIILQPVGDHDLAFFAAHALVERLDRLDHAVCVFRADSAEHY